MKTLFKVNIYTPENTVIETEAVSLVAPAALGYLGILANHAPLAATTTPGRITIRDNAGKLIAINSRGTGFLEVLNNNVTILLESA